MKWISSLAKCAIAASLSIAAGAGGLSGTGQRVVASVECRLAETPIKIDGKLDDPAWAKSQVVKEFVIPRAARPPRTSSAFRTSWDIKYFYFAAEMQDADLYGDLKKRNAMTWNNDVIELFIRPTDKKLPLLRVPGNTRKHAARALLSLAGRWRI
jgi:hypothetical protein